MSSLSLDTNPTAAANGYSKGWKDIEKTYSPMLMDMILEKGCKGTDQKEEETIITLDVTTPWTIQMRLRPKETGQGLHSQQLPPTPLTGGSPNESKAPNNLKTKENGPGSRRPHESALSTILKEHVRDFVKNTNTLISTLDEAAKTHSVIQDVVSSFKAAVELELAWDKHNDKTVALNLTMCDMMLVFTKLREVPDLDKSDRDSLQGLKDDIISSIKLCAKVCDSYRKQHDIDESFMRKWQDKFVEVALKFATHKANILSDTSIQGLIQASVGTAAAVANDTLDTMQTNMEKLVGNIREFMKVAFGINSSEEGVSRHGSSTEEDNTKTISELPGVHKDVEQVLANNGYFDKKFKVTMRLQADETRMSITAHRRIDTLESGHEGIIDRDICEVWKQKGWRDSVAAKLLVTALCDHFENDGLPKTSDASQVVGKSIADAVDPNASGEDKWDLKCIRAVFPKQPLLEEPDSDLSVTVSEVNAFTAAKPRTWSLLRWLSYWTSQDGFETTLQWYLHRISDVIVEIQESSKPHNLESGVAGQICKAMGVLSELRDLSEKWTAPAAGNFNWKDHYEFCKFKNDVLEKNEEEMNQSLRTLNYELDVAIKGIIVAQKDRPEKYNLPLILSLGIKARNIFKQVGSLNADDLRLLDVIFNSLSILALSSEPQGKPQNQNKRDFLSGLCFALNLQAQKHRKDATLTRSEDPVLPKDSPMPEKSMPSPS